VAKLERDAARFTAQSVLLKAQGDRDAAAADNAAQAAVFAAQAQAFGTGLDFARFVFYQRIGPRIESVLSTDGPDGLGALFLPYLPKGKEVAP
jgi:regulator of protease activity HflC (stomatin/prohibitin superfamily)